MLLLLLPTNVLEAVIEELPQGDKARLGATCLELLHLTSLQLYKNVLVVSSDERTIRLSSSSLLDVRHLPTFVRALSTRSFSYIDSILIHAQSNLVEYDYAPLHTKIIRLWQIIDHPIHFANYDIQNLRDQQSLTAYAFQQSTTYVENEEEQYCEHLVSHRIPKVNLLKSWEVLSIQELLDLPFNPNLESLNVFIERRMLSPPISATQSALSRNLLQLRSLYLSLPTSTYAFFRLQQSCPRLENLTQLSISNTHTHKNDTILTLGGVNRRVNLNNLRALELKVNCVHEFCGSQCIPAMFADWADYNRITGETPRLQKLAVVNFKSCNTKKNIQEFGNLVSTSLFAPQFDNLEELYVNIEDYQNLTLADTDKNFDFSKFTTSLLRHPNLKKLVIPDFFNAWISSVPRMLQVERDYFDVLVNQCNCSECHASRFRFSLMASYDSKNHYTHKFLSLDCCYDGGAHYIDTANDDNLKLLSYLVLNFRHQFSHLHQNLFSVNSILQTSEERLFVADASLELFGRLFRHSCLGQLMAKIHENGVGYVNLGGIESNQKRTSMSI